MSSRNDILRSIRRHLPQSTPLPEDGGNWIRFDDPVLQFSQVLESVGGDCYIVESVADIGPMLEGLAGSHQRVICGVPGLLGPVFDFASVADPQDLADVELAILPGKFAVAENAAVWVQTDSPAQRTLYYIAQHLVLVVPHAEIVHNLPEAYERIDPVLTQYGCFISGPSKTADIEQSLVKGAHGARTLRVFLVRE
ncbi:LutC/YkgG family protein [Planctomicrobium sp. SH661]|uniref:LutC/YkgG family protein n=1 Tax=Planctomicrobium sp. SH661 TaxID=3448124 RepID=UPI003F5BC3DA